MDISKERYERVRERIKRLEAEKAELEARGEPAPSRLEGDLFESRMQAYEIRLHGHRAHVQEVRRKRLQDALQDALERAAITGPEIRARRTGAGLTLEDLAAVSGVSKSHLGMIETGDTRPSKYVLCRIADALDFVEEGRALLEGAS